AQETREPFRRLVRGVAAGALLDLREELLFASATESLDVADEAEPMELGVERNEAIGGVGLDGLVALAGDPKAPDAVDDLHVLEAELAKLVEPSAGEHADERQPEAMVTNPARARLVDVGLAEASGIERSLHDSVELRDRERP